VVLGVAVNVLAATEFSRWLEFRESGGEDCEVGTFFTGAGLRMGVIREAA